MCKTEKNHAVNFQSVFKRSHRMETASNYNNIRELFIQTVVDLKCSSYNNGSWDLSILLKQKKYIIRLEKR